MRMRKKKHGDERIDACSAMLISRPSDIYDSINRERGENFGKLDTANAKFPGEFFSEERRNFPVSLEIGCGKGDFISAISARDRDMNFIAMEMISDVACIALEKAEASKDSRPDNLRFIIGNAKHLPGYIKPHSIDCIYLNFSDPWPKKGHAKRRLTHSSFLELYKELLCKGGMLKFKTDNVSLFDFSLEEFEAFGLETVFLTRDLHASELAKNNIMTEYERNFSSKGMPIMSVWVKFN